MISLSVCFLCVLGTAIHVAPLCRTKSGIIQFAALPIAGREREREEKKEKGEVGKIGTGQAWMKQRHKKKSGVYSNSFTSSLLQQKGPLPVTLLCRIILYSGWCVLEYF